MRLKFLNEQPMYLMVIDVQMSAECIQKETPNNTSGAGGIGGCGMILDSGAAASGPAPVENRLCAGLSRVVLEQDRVWAFRHGPARAGFS